MTDRDRKGDWRPICVLGSPRSGTSLTAKAINLLGFDIGPVETMRTGDEAGLDPAIKDLNPTGFWEQREVTSLNGSILEALGGSEVAPPVCRPGWEAMPHMAPFRAQARDLVERLYGGSSPWVVKDPRMVFTLPLWRAVAVEFDFVLCNRNPLEAIASVQGYLPPAADGFELWLRYSCEALRGTAGSRRLFVFNENWYTEPHSVVLRLAEFLGGAEGRPDERDLERAVKFVEPSLHRQSATDLDLAERTDVPAGIRAFHFLVRDLAAAEAAGQDRATALHALTASLDARQASGQISRSPLSSSPP